MRIGTWNLEGRWDARHAALLASLDCDVLLLTEVVERVAIPGLRLHASAEWMAPGRRWAAVAAPDLTPLADPHGASAMAVVNDLRVCSSILPWRNSGSRAPWDGAGTAGRTANAVAAIEASTPDVWGGDWNHALTGREYVGSVAGRQSILDAVDRLGLTVPTAGAPHRIDGTTSIDHVAVPATWTVTDVQRIPAVVDGKAVSDHDAYVVTAAEPAALREGDRERS